MTQVNDVLEHLKSRMKERTPILLLGAGFSRGAVNKNGDYLKLGKELANELYTEFYINNFPEMENMKTKKYRQYVENCKENLLEICTLLCSEKRTDERNKYLKDLYSGCYPDENNPFQNKLLNYEWRLIFTLNIDDLVENIFQFHQKPLERWNFSNFGKRDHEKDPLLVKLHGCISDIDNGFIFDRTEYNKYTSRQPALLKKFSDEFLQNDVVIIGTEFQENDLQITLDIYKSSGFNNQNYHYFFVTPSIVDMSFQNEIESNENMHWVKMTAEEFLEYLTLNISKEERSSILKEKGTFLNDLFSTDENYKSDIYKGDESSYLDFFNGWDIKYHKCDSAVDDFINQQKNGFISLWGKSYVGKTCVAKRILVDFMNKGYIAIELDRVDSNNITEEFIKYLEKLEPNSRIALFVDDAAYQYQDLVKMMQFCPTKIDRFVIITADNIIHDVNFYKLQRSSYYAKYIHISEEVDSNYARNIYEKLNEKQRLGKFYTRFQKQSTSKKIKETSKNAEREIIYEIKGMNDIIEVLYFSHTGRSFKTHYNKLIEKNKDKNYIECLKSICVLGELGIEKIPTRLLAHLPGSLKIENLCENFPEIIHVENGKMRVRCKRILNDVIEKQNCDVIEETLRQTALYTSGLFSEKQNNEHSELFQKTLKTKEIKKRDLLPAEKIYSLLQSLEKEFSEYSYFWIQYGLAAQQIEKYEDAENHLNYALIIRPNSYQAKHALAKNWMERGLYELKEGDIFSADITFEKGKEAMKKILLSEFNSNAYKHSVHSYIDMVLEYSKKGGSKLQEEEIDFITQSIKKLYEDDFDKLMKDVIKKYIEYCENNGFSIQAMELNAILNTTNSYEIQVTENYYDEFI